MSEPEIGQAVSETASEAETTSSAVSGQSAALPTPSSRFTWLDLLELVIVLSAYTYFFWNFIPQLLNEPTWGRALVIPAEGLTILVLLARRSARSITTSPIAWLLALGTSAMPALIRPAPQPFAPVWVGITLLIAGVCGRIACTAFLGRSFGVVAANRGVKRSGPYRLVRHPIYATYFITYAGIFLLTPSFWNTFVYMVTFILLIWRIEVEEIHLSQDPAYVEYQKVVRYRLLPGLY